MKRAPLLFLMGALLLAGPSLAAAGTLCHTTVEQACACCRHPEPSAPCRMGCADASEARRADAPRISTASSDSSAAVLLATSLQAAGRDAAAGQPVRSARAPDTSPEALYLLDRTLRL